MYILVSVATMWTQGNCLGWGPSNRTGLAGTEYHRTLNRVVRALQSLPRRQFFLSWLSGLAVTICDDRAARRWHCRFKSGCTPIFLYIYIYIADKKKTLLIDILQEHEHYCLEAFRPVLFKRYIGLARYKNRTRTVRYIRYPDKTLSLCKHLEKPNNWLNTGVTQLKQG